ncbi:hypothetical protein DCC26_11310 [Auritidibacter sp. NML120779]|nr:hypothetical protein DCC26_11310 [Auritidibacter sp. NML120779]
MINDDQLPAPSLPIQRVPDALDVGTLDAHKLDPSRFWLAHQGTLLGQSFQIGFTIPSVGDAVRFAELLEAQRQAGLAYVHQVLHAPKDRVFILDWIVLSSQINEAPGPHAWSVGEITVEPREVAGDGRRTRRAVLAFTIHARGAEIGDTTSPDALLRSDTHAMNCAGSPEQDPAPVEHLQGFRRGARVHLK